MSLFRLPFFKWLGSLPMAVGVLLLLAVVLAAGTVVESLYSAGVARRFVYGTGWFAALLAFLALNLTCSALVRLPWRRHHAGFLLAHLGIVVVLAGSLMTQRLGRDGQITLAEGEEGRTIQEPVPTLYAQWEGGPLHVFPADFRGQAPSAGNPARFALEPGLLLTVEEFLLSAREQEDARLPAAGEEGTPALRVSLRNSFVEERRWLFLGHPDRADVRLGPASLHLVRRGDKPREPAPNAVALEWVEGKVRARLRTRGKWGAPVPLAEGEALPTGWMGMELALERVLPGAVPEISYAPAPLPRGKDPSPALRWRVRHPEEKAGWIGYRRQKVVTVGGKPLSLAYLPRQVRLPFALRLDDFRIGYDPGTAKPASFESLGAVLDLKKGIETPFHIRMNEPLRYGGWTFYQASYVDRGDGTFLSVLSAGRDPGVPVKYAGSVVLVAGVAAMFLFRKPKVFNTVKEIKEEVEGKA